LDCVLRLTIWHHLHHLLQVAHYLSSTSCQNAALDFPKLRKFRASRRSACPYESPEAQVSVVALSQISTTTETLPIRLCIHGISFLFLQKPPPMFHKYQREVTSNSAAGRTCTDYVLRECSTGTRPATSIIPDVWCSIAAERHFRPKHLKHAVPCFQPHGDLCTKQSASSRHHFSTESCCTPIVITAIR
jgi:hypothetical protein